MENFINNYINTKSLKYLPKFSIIAFNSNVLPTGWYLCNGNTYNGFETPDLRGRFILGSGEITIDNNNKDIFNYIKKYN